MEKKTRKKREAPISYRPPAELRDAFRERVERSGLTTCAFITKAVFDQAPARASRRPPIEAKDLAKLLAEAAAIREQLHEISLSGGANHTVPVEHALAALLDIRAALLAALGRQP